MPNILFIPLNFIYLVMGEEIENNHLELYSLRVYSRNELSTLIL
jgi:hypothetical protein